MRHGGKSKRFDLAQTSTHHTAFAAFFAGGCWAGRAPGWLKDTTCSALGLESAMLDCPHATILFPHSLLG